MTWNDFLWCLAVGGGCAMWFPAILLWMKWRDMQ